MHEVDLIIIGAGPAGMSAAWRAAECGLSVLILDEQPAAGGQIYRDVDCASALRGDILGKDFTGPCEYHPSKRCRGMADRRRAAGVLYPSGAGRGGLRETNSFGHRSD